MSLGFVASRSILPVCHPLRRKCKLLWTTQVAVLLSVPSIHFFTHLVMESAGRSIGLTSFDLRTRMVSRLTPSVQTLGPIAITSSVRSMRTSHTTGSFKSKSQVTNGARMQPQGFLLLHRYFCLGKSARTLRPFDSLARIPLMRLSITLARLSSA